MASLRVTEALWFLCICLTLGAAARAGAIITRDDVADREYVVDDSAYPEVVDLLFRGACSGTLVHERHLVTVAHCADGLEAGAVVKVAGVTHRVDEVILHPLSGARAFDIALVRLEERVEGVTPVLIYRGSDELGQTLTLVGRGVHATGLEGEAAGVLDGKLRRATNVVSAVYGEWLEVYFEPPEDPGATGLEGVGAAGDSGGPAFIETEAGRFLAGLNAWSDSRQDSAVGRYGAWNYSTRVSHFAEWIDAELGVVPSGAEDESAAISDVGSSGCGAARGVDPYPHDGAILLLVAALPFIRGRRRVGTSTSKRD